MVGADHEFIKYSGIVKIIKLKNYLSSDDKLIKKKLVLALILSKLNLFCYANYAKCSGVIYSNIVSQCWQTGLVLVLNVHQYDGIEIDTAGVLVSVSPQYQTPSPEDESIVVGPGLRTMLSISKVFI